MAVPRKIGRYEILEELGHGAMGAVYRAKDPAMGRIVAVKTILSVALASTQENEFRERFYREARAAGGLAHPGIVPIFDVGEHEGMPFLVMEFINGRTLNDVVKKGERLSLERACEIGQRVAEALGYAHQHGVVHRDIKPANILLTSKETYGIERPKIADFGVAKMAEGSTTMTGQLLGTPAFMPPEQFTGGPIDGRADIFSLGVVLYWMATGEQAFPGESLTAVSYKVVHTEPVPPRKLNAWLPVELETAIMKCLAKSPDDRYQTAEELAQQLGKIREQGKGGVRKPSPPAVVVDPNAPTMVGAATVTAAAARPALAAEPATAIQSSQAPGVAAPSAGKKNQRSIWLMLAGVITVVVAASGWYTLRIAGKSEASKAASSAGPIASADTAKAATPDGKPVSNETDATPSPPAVNKTIAMASASEKSAGNSSPAMIATPKKPSSGAAAAGDSLSAKVIEGKPAARTTVNTAPSTTSAGPPAPGVDFDPKTLDPKLNAKLKLDWKHMPSGVEFTVEMNGKRYFQRTGAGGSAQDAELLVPPGVQEFRVTARSGSVSRTSNTVSAEFKAKKRLTLRIEVRAPGVNPDQGVPQGLYADTQVVVALK